MPISGFKASALLIGFMILPLWEQPASWAAIPDAASGQTTSGQTTSGQTTSGQTTSGQTAIKAVSPADNAVLNHVNQRLASLKQSLAITPAQQPDWHGFATVMRSNATGLWQMYNARNAKLGTMNAPANIESYAAITGRQADDMNALSAAFQTLYAVLTPTQQHKADMLFRLEAKQHAK